MDQRLAPAIEHAELMTVGCDEIVVTARSAAGVEMQTRVGDREVVTRGPFHVAEIFDLEPGFDYPLELTGPQGMVEASRWLPPSVRTLDRPTGRRMCTIATANDLHFGETQCGILDGIDPDEFGPVMRIEPGEDPYPLTMNAAAVAAIEAMQPAADLVLVKGDVTTEGLIEEYEAFLSMWSVFGDRFRHVRGNHDAKKHHDLGIEGAPYTVDLPGVKLAVIDTVWPGRAIGRITRDQIDWLADVAAETSTPMLVFGHHPVWIRESGQPRDSYFGVDPDDSLALAEVIQRSEAIAGYFAGHTHRNHVDRFRGGREVPMVEVACVKDYPGMWSEIQVFADGYLHLDRRIIGSRALDWSERTRVMFGGFYRDYALGGLDDRCLAGRF